MAFVSTIVGHLRSFQAAATITTVMLIGAALYLWSKRANNEGYAVRALRTLVTTQGIYKTSHPDKGFASALPLLSQNRFQGICHDWPTCGVDTRLAETGEYHGYKFTLVAKTSNGITPEYWAVATPILPGITGRRTFCTDQSGTIRVSGDAQCTRQMPPLLIVLGSLFQMLIRSSAVSVSSRVARDTSPQMKLGRFVLDMNYRTANWHSGLANQLYFHRSHG